LDSDSEPSNARISSDNDEVENLCLMAKNHKNNKVSDSKTKTLAILSYNELQIYFENLHCEAKYTFKKLAVKKKSYFVFGSQSFRNKKSVSLQFYCSLSDIKSMGFEFHELLSFQKLDNFVGLKESYDES